MFYKKMVIRSIFYSIIFINVVLCYSGSSANAINKNVIFPTVKHNGPLKVSIIGSGSWGTVISKIISENTQRSKIFHPIVRMYVNEEIIDNEKLSDIINKTKENVKYMKGMKLPNNIVAIPDIDKVIEGADLLIFVVPHQYLKTTLSEILKNKNLKSTAKAISLMKGVKICDYKPMLLSNIIENMLNIECSVLSGSNIASELSTESFSEATIGFENLETAEIWRDLFDRNYFKINCIQDKAGVEMCGALKNVVALGVGFSEAFKKSYNTKSAIIRIGLEEMKKFAKLFFPNVLDETFLDSCGVADVIATCLGGRNVKCATEFAFRNGQDSWDKIESELLNGQKLQGVYTSKEIYKILENRDLKSEFPLFSIIYEIAFGYKHPSSITSVLSTKKLRHIKYRK
ncbi:glycerol-3-phosphate dehydrogenase, putative [Plasmodium berghei]|uniref:Glycerol-3-phosphate dehydrogenase [NAD(+)] n=3 Tax=Plasmodium berghei TaxID=5821 RepID=A0A509AK47_PLABA|nr:glycerol-3-phosphate dehydrogenase, putative [Plasmodium berghei ANKA]SCN25532.1 glycerol-3-phosphate dehydrogenase, putative [Plasmodium berghei]SCO60487.1 glycerol-3-phosphate dehydrogenase, putative [Plasmodium berghei]VUC55869.1 glycerol-3-phosphate dehydrogenase, putative [Plasmodium berghei ANKA]|eukprot:XP_034421679.1 glycerol-3-phosphate dehydrogenase, putative [Plasmodium berghei ANKA]